MQHLTFLIEKVLLDRLGNVIGLMGMWNTDIWHVYIYNTHVIYLCFTFLTLSEDYICVLCPSSETWYTLSSYMGNTLFIVTNDSWLKWPHAWLFNKEKKTPILLSAAPAVSTLVFDTYLGIVWISAKYTKKTKKITTQNLLTWVNNNESAISISPPFTRNHRCILV